MPEIIVKLGDSIVQKNIFVKETIRIGRVPDNEIVVENLAVSRYHSVIDYEDGHYILSDLDSSNGTFVNGVRIKKTELQDRDVITIGKHKLYFYDQRATTEPKPRPAIADIERTMLVEQAGTPPQAELEIIKGRQKGTHFVINGAQTSIGRGGFNDIQLTDWFVSKVHAVIERRGSEFVIRDLGSWRHTYVNGIMVHELPLADGDTIQMGPTVQLTFCLVRQEQPLPPSARVPVELAPGSDESLRGPRFPERETADFDETRLVRSAAAQQEKGPTPSSILASAGGFPVTDSRNPWGKSAEPNGDLEQDDDAGAGQNGTGPNEMEADELQDPGFAPAHPPTRDERIAMPDSAADEITKREAILETAPILKIQPAEPWDLGDAADDEMPEETPAEEAEPEMPAAAAGSNGRAAAAQAEPAETGASDSEIAMWERALKNKNPIIRKQAARQLQKLTGKEYDYS